MKTLKTLALIGLLAILAAIGAAVYFFGGLYSVAASAEEPAFVKWALVKVRQASIERHAKDRPASAARGVIGTWSSYARPLIPIT